MEKPLKEIVKDKMNELGMTPQDLEKATGIPAARIYKWYSKAKAANPKEADAEVLKKWLGGSSKSSDLKNEAEDYMGQPLIQVVLNLTYIGKKNADSMDRMTVSMDKMADSNLQNSKSIATLVNLIASNSDLAALLTSSPMGLHRSSGDASEDVGLPAEAFLGKVGTDLSKKTQPDGKRKVKGS